MIISKRKEYKVAKIIQQSKQKPRIIFNSKMWLIIGAIVVISAIGVAWICLSPKEHKSRSPSVSSNVSGEKASEATKQVNSIVETSGPTAAQEYLDNLISKTNDSAEQSRLYLDKAILAGSYSGGRDLSLALEYAYKAEALSPTKDTALTIGINEENSNNISAAIKYYKLYLDRIPHDTSDASDYSYYVEHVKGLEKRQ